MWSTVDPVYWPIPTTVNRNRLPSLTVSLRRGEVIHNPAAMMHNMVYGWRRMEKWWDFAAAGLALVAAGCWFLSASGQLPAMITYWDQTARQ